MSYLEPEAISPCITFTVWTISSRFMPEHFFKKQKEQFENMQEKERAGGPSLLPRLSDYHTYPARMHE